MWIITAWQHISPEVSEVFKKCSISNAVDGTDELVVEWLWKGLGC